MSDNGGSLSAGGGPASLPPGPAVHKTRRQRRPTGAPPPLPHPVTITTTAWLVLAAVALTGAFVASQHTPWLRIEDRASTWVLRQLAAIRTPWLTDIANGIKAAGTGWVTVLGASVIVLTMVFRRWRHLLVFMGSVLFLDTAGTLIYNALSRPRPYGVPIITSWAGYSGASPPVAVLTIILMGAVYCLAVPGRPRTYTKAAVAAAVALFSLARLYLGVDHPGDVLLGAAFAVAIAVTAFRYFTPNEVFPVVYRRGRTAHVDVTGRRGEAIRTAVRDQLGLTVLEIKPVGLASSAGSTPLRLRVEGGSEKFLFAKLYTKGHVRADRWYKLGRTILYGSLEDESAFKTVRRLVTYEDYALRLLQDIGVRTARPHGVVEITPEREYLLVTEFFAGAVEIGEADIGDGVIDQGLGLIRKLWDAGIAHRDIKPGNLMVRAGELLLIDVAFAQVRPSPWRQAVRPGQHDARARRAHRPGNGLPAGTGLLHPRRARRSLRRHPRRGQPHPATRIHETRPPGPARLLPRPRTPPGADRAAALEHPAGRTGGRGAGHHRCRRGYRSADRRPGRESGRLRPQLRDRPLDDSQRPGSPVGGQAALPCRAPLRLECWRRGHFQREGQPVAGLRPRGTSSHHRHPDRHL